MFVSKVDKEKYPDVDQEFRFQIQKMQKYIDILEKLNEKHDLGFYYAGGIVPYLLLDEESGRQHSDIDLIIDKEKIEKFREVTKHYSLYNEDTDSLTYKDEDFGFEFFYENMKFGVFPFTTDGNLIRQYSYNSDYDQFKIRELDIMKTSDYILEYESKDGKKYEMMSLEYIKLTKEEANREKDRIDIEAIDKTGQIREEVYDRIKSPREVYNEIIQSKNNKGKKRDNRKSKSDFER